MQTLIANINDITISQYMKTWKNLNYEQQSKIKSLTTEEAKKRSLGGYFLLHQGLEDFFHISIHKIEITYNKNGKPKIMNFPIHYNISHCKDYCVCVFSKYPIGVDIEQIRPFSKSILSSYFSKDEIAYIGKNEKRFFTLFTLKESYIKMMGTTVFQIKRLHFPIVNQQLSFPSSPHFSVDISIKNYIISICEK